jgi:hypothetical protein
MTATITLWRGTPHATGEPARAHRWSLEHGLPTAAVVRSSYATPARRRGQACLGDPPNSIAFGAALSTPAILAGVDNAVAFTLIADT